MSFVDMTNEEWEEVRRHHDELVHMAELELEAEVITESRPAAPHWLKPVSTQLSELDHVVANIQH